MNEPGMRTGRRRIWIGVTALVVVMVLVFSTVPSSEQAALELPEHVDIFDGIQIEEPKVPLADQHVTTSKSTTRKTVKLKNKSKKTYTRNLPDKVSKSTDDKIVGSFRVVAYKTVKTSTQEKYKKGSRKKTVTTTVTTTIATTVDDLAPESTNEVSLQNQSATLNEHEQSAVKTTKKTVKIKKAKKSYTKALPVKTKTTTEEKIVGSYKVVITTTVKTAVTEKYVKNKKKKTVTTTVTTTVVTKVYRLPNEDAEDTERTVVTDDGASMETDESKTNASDNSSSEPSKNASENKDDTVKQGDTAGQPVEDQNKEQGQGQTTEQTTNGTVNQQMEQDSQQITEQTTGSGIRKSASKAGDNILNAFEKLGFTFSVDGGYAYSGYFSARERCIIIKKDNDNVYHELGHFVAFAAGNVDTGSAFKSIYNEEKGLYDGRNATYVLSTSSEYFAESYREYVLDRESLKKKRPKTYAAIDSAVNRVTDAQIGRIQALYGSMWE